jgi:MHS family proline/betaine transporter-like MFS transporter
MLAGMLLGALLYRPIFDRIHHLADTSSKEVIANTTLPGKNSDGVMYSTFRDGSSLSLQSTVTPQGVKTKKIVKLGSDPRWKITGLVAIMVLFVTMVYGPIAAFLVELFPTRIRYTSMSLPYHIGNGVFGGLVPFIAVLVTTLPGSNHLSGLWYPIIIAGLCFIIGSLYLKDRKRDDASIPHQITEEK